MWGPVVGAALLLACVEGEAGMAGEPMMGSYLVLQLMQMLMLLGQRTRARVRLKELSRPTHLAAVAPGDSRAVAVDAAIAAAMAAAGAGGGMALCQR